MLKNITLSAEQHLIEHAREKAKKSKQTLNALFRQWLIYYLKENGSTTNYEKLMKSLAYSKPGKHFSRDELNER